MCVYILGETGNDYNLTFYCGSSASTSTQLHLRNNLLFYLLISIVHRQELYFAHHHTLVFSSTHSDSTSALQFNTPSAVVAKTLSRTNILRFRSTVCIFISLFHFTIKLHLLSLSLWLIWSFFHYSRELPPSRNYLLTALSCSTATPQPLPPPTGIILSG